MWIQKEITIRTQGQGLYLITSQIVQNVPEIKSFRIGLMHLFLKHTSASLLINENYDPSVQKDLHNYFNQLSHLYAHQFSHTSEGTDDMPAHLLNTLIGCSLLIPITNGKINLGTWQGIYIYEHRYNNTTRTLLITIWGESN